MEFEAQLKELEKVMGEVKRAAPSLKGLTDSLKGFNALSPAAEKKTKSGEAQVTKGGLVLIQFDNLDKAMAFYNALK